jgi:cell division protein ZapA
MSESHNTVSINILGKLYKVKCPPEKILELRESAQYLESKMRELNQSNKILNADRLATIAALNLAHELLLQKKQANHYIEAMSHHIHELQNKIEVHLYAEEN